MDKPGYIDGHTLPPYAEQEIPLISKGDVESEEEIEEITTDSLSLRRRRLLATVLIALIVSTTVLPFLVVYTCSTGMARSHHGKAVKSYYDYIVGAENADKKKCNGRKAEKVSNLAKRDIFAREEKSGTAEEGRQKKLENAQKEIEQIKQEEANKLKDISQNNLKYLEREISVQDQDNFQLDLGLWNASSVVEPSGQKIMILTATDGNGANGEIRNILQMAESNRREYCDYHNYVYKFINISRFDLKLVHPVWGKLNAIQAAFDEHPTVEWIWWMDLDMIIMNPEIDLARYLLNPEAMKRRLSYGRPLKHPSYAEYSNIRTGYNPDKPLPPNAAKPKINDVESEDYEYADVNKIDMLICQDFFGLNAGSFFIRRSEFVTMLLDYWGDTVFINQEFRFREQDTLGHLNINHRLIREHIGVVPQRMLNSYISDDLWSGYEEGDLSIHFAGCWIPGDCDDRWMRNWKVRGRVPEGFRNTIGDDARRESSKST